MEKKNLRWVWIFGVLVMEVSKEREKKNLILKKKGEAVVWRREI